MKTGKNIRITCLASITFLLGVIAQQTASADLVFKQSTPTASTVIGTWYERDLPPCFHAQDDVMFYAYNDADMDGYLRSVGLADGTSYANSTAGEIDGLFDNRHMRISLRVNPQGNFDRETLTHEYGHYVWFHIFDQPDRATYASIYNQSRRHHRLITDYAATNLEEGFAETFAYYVIDPVALHTKDSRAFDFLSEWAANRTADLLLQMTISIPNETPLSQPSIVSVPRLQLATATEVEAFGQVNVAEALATPEAASQVEYPHETSVQ